MSELRTDRLVLSPVVEADADFVLELLNDPGWIASIGDRGVRSLEDARRFIREQFQKNLWLVVRDPAGDRLGVCGVILDREGMDRPDLGYALLQRHAGKGYATEAATAVLRHARDVMRLEQIAAITAPENTASQRVLEKLGFRYVELRELPIGKSAYYLA